MQASRYRTISRMSNSDTFYYPQPFDQYSSYNNTGNESFHCTLESSSINLSHTMYNSTSSLDFLQTEITTIPLQEPKPCHSPVSDSCLTEDANNLKHKLQELENAMFGPDIDVLDNYENTALQENWRQMMSSVSRGELKEILISCAKSISDNDLLTAQWLISELRQIVSVSGDPVQRLGAYMLEGLVAKMSSSGSWIYNSFECKLPANFELLSYNYILHEICPYFKFGYMSANGAIAESMKGENKIHIIDFQIGQGSQWVSLIRAFSTRPGGPPSIRITGVDDSSSAYARGGGLEIVGLKLMKLAEKYRVPFEFNMGTISGCGARPENFEIRPGEALAVNFAFMLHHMPDESVTTENHRDRLLRMVKVLNPKVVTLVEQEFNTNTAAFYPRFLEALDYYMAMFDSIDVCLPRENRERINVEQFCLARDVVNIMACEGIERVERHEVLGKWKSRFRMAGFSEFPLSPLVNKTIKRLLGNYCSKYRLVERDGALFLGWMERDLIASCAWK